MLVSTERVALEAQQQALRVLEQQSESLEVRNSAMHVRRTTQETWQQTRIGDAHGSVQPQQLKYQVDSEERDNLSFTARDAFFIIFCGLNVAFWVAVIILGISIRRFASQTAQAAAAENTPILDPDQHGRPDEPETTHEPETGQHVVRQQSREQMQANPTEDAIQAQLVEDARVILEANKNMIIWVGFLFVAIMLTLFGLLVIAIVAVLDNHKKSCDQPLKYYLMVSIVWSQIPRLVQETMRYCECSVNARMVVTILLALPGWAILGWGMYMVGSADTCPETNPGLYFPTRNFIFAHLLCNMLLLSCTVILLLGLRRFLLYLGRLHAGKGCVQAVHELPKVQVGSAELLAEDGQVVACSICLEPLSDQERPIVRTPCRHCFHEECLAHWCENRLTCPLCRQQVGEPDTNKDAP
jgi:hypothetical protein